MPEPLRGIVPPMITPLANSNRLDVPGLERLVEHIVGGANLDPALFIAMYHAAAAGQADSVAELQRRLIGLDAVYGFDDNSMGVIKGLKAALHYLGVCSDAVADPLRPLSRHARKELHSILRSLGYAPGWPKHRHRHVARRDATVLT